MELLYRDNKLVCDGVDLEGIAKEYGTPAFVYSYNSIKDAFYSYKNALKGVPHIMCYALKTNSTLAIASVLADMGAGADIVSGGELFRAVKTGFDSRKIVYSGVGKTDEEIDYAIKSDILMFNIESTSELNNINKRAKAIGRKVGISLRVNPDVDPKTHPYISTGLAKNKFGIDINEAEEIYKYAKTLKWVTPIGIHMHIGSQILDVSPYEEAFQKLYNLFLRLKDHDIKLKYFNIGGGLGISYDPKSQKDPSPKNLVKNIIDYIKKENITILLEPGRSIIGRAGMLITKVLYNKETRSKKFIIVDAGMNDIARPSIYDAYHEIVPLDDSNRSIKVADIVGPICESTDFLAKDRQIVDAKEGDYLLVKNAGAYCFSMSSNYNSRRRAAEILIKDDKAVLIRKRESYDDLIRGEIDAK